LENGKGIARTIGLAASMVGVSDRTLKEWLGKGCPGEPGRYVVPEIVQWAKVSVWSVIPTGDDLMDGGGDSPALEQYRLAKAALARLDLAEREKQLVRVEEVVEPLMEAAAVVRAAGERIGREYGPDAQEVVNEAVAEFVASLKRFDGEG
jgi:hypothetical protein